MLVWALILGTLEVQELINSVSKLQTALAERSPGIHDEVWLASLAKLSRNKEDLHMDLRAQRTTYHPPPKKKDY